MERILAHVEKIDWVRDIPGADKICTYGVLGWEVIDQKNKYNVGDKIIYVEIDSVMPDKPEYEFLRDKKFRIKTIKLKGQVSQGLILPMSILQQEESYFSLGAGITKYLSPSEKEEIYSQEKKIANEKNKLKKFMMRYSFFRRLFLSKKQKSGFPYWVSKTDEERIQNLDFKDVIEKFGDSEVYITEKIDYQSGTWTGKMVPVFNGFLGKIIPIKRYQFVVCSRNLENKDKNSLYWKIAIKYNLEKILRENPTLTIQGEQGDTKVQGNKYGITEPTMWVFNIIDHEKDYQYNYYEMKTFCNKYNLNIVPLVRIPEYGLEANYSNLSSIGSTVPEFVEFSKGKSVINPKVNREGIVVRCIENGKKLLSFKVINPNFLLKYE